MFSACLLVTLAFIFRLPALAMTSPKLTVGKITSPSSVIIYVGDSRTYMLYSSTSTERKTNAVFVSKGGGFVEDLLKKPMYTYLTAAIRRFPAAPVILNLGVNGMQGNEDGENIVAVYQKLIKTFPKTKFFVESINPTAYRGGIHSNKKVIAINQTLYRTFPGRYIDCYNYLLKMGYVSLSGSKGFRKGDRLHYNRAACEEILSATRRWISWKTGRSYF